MSGVLVLSLLGAIFNTIFSGLFVVVNTPKGCGDLEYWLLLVLLAVSIYAIICVFQTYKWKRKGAVGLLSTMVVSIFFLLLGAFYKEPITDTEKSGAGTMLIMAFVCTICAIILACHLKKIDQ